MPRLSLIQTNFTAGEISPRMLGRVDIARYANGAETLENCWPVVHGGAFRRAGTLFCAETKTSSKKTRLIPYVFNKSQAYIMEFGDLYVRFYYPDGTRIEVSGTPVEVVSPYSESMLFDIDYVQGADTMFIFHPSVPVYRMRRDTNVVWSLAPAPFVVQPFDEIGIRVTSNTLTLSNTTIGPTRTFTTVNDIFKTTDIGREIWAGAGVAKIVGVTNPKFATVDIKVGFASTTITDWSIKNSPQTQCTPSAKDPVGAGITLTLASAGWRPEDVGKFVRINGGLCEITSYSSDTVVAATIRTALTATVASPTNAWSLESSVWNANDGYPGTGTLHEQRLVCAGSPSYPQTIWMSKTGEYLNFELGTADDSAMAFTVSSDQINPIAHMAQIKALVALTYGGEFSMLGGVEKPITPTNVQVKNQSSYGCNKVKPVRIGNELYFIQRAGRKLRAMAYRYDSDAYGAPDMSVLSEHITEGGIVDMAYQQEPESILFLVRADGKIATLTIDRDQDVIGWASQSTDGLFESVASIPTSDGEQIWCVVNRTIGGVTKRYVERFTFGAQVDSGLVKTDAVGLSTWTGFSHLEGRTVDIVADGVPMQPKVVTSGQITLPRAAKTVQVGLHFKTTIKTLTPEVAGGTGTAQGNNMRISEVILRILESTGCRVNGQTVAFRNMGPDILDRPPEVFTGDKRIETTGFERGKAQLLIEQDLPLPLNVLSVIKKFTVND